VSPCTICVPKNPPVSVGETEVKHYIESLGCKVDHYDVDFLDKLGADIVVEANKIIVEYDGLYWHSELYKSKNYHVLKKLLAEQKPAPAAEPKTVKEFVGTPVNVFFNLDKYNIASQKDLVNVQGIAKYAKDNGANLLVTGYADSATGKAPHNQWLSEKRAETVANELVKMGVSRDKIETAAKGGVNDLSPISFNRRATVQVK